MNGVQVSAAALRTRAAAILAAKFMLTDRSHPVDVLLSAALPAFLEHLSDPEWCSPPACPQPFEHELVTVERLMMVTAATHVRSTWASL